MSSPPRITSAELSATQTLAGVPINVLVEWAGEPRVSPTYQWRNDTLILRGETGAVFTPAEEMPLLNCRVHIDNGRGYAVAVARLEPSTAVSPESFVFEAGVFEAGVFE